METPPFIFFSLTFGIRIRQLASQRKWPQACCQLSFDSALERSVLWQVQNSCGIYLLQTWKEYLERINLKMTRNHMGCATFFQKGYKFFNSLLSWTELSSVSLIFLQHETQEITNDCSGPAEWRGTRAPPNAKSLTPASPKQLKPCR